jgi:TrpR-related protein YerC/YecD
MKELDIPGHHRLFEAVLSLKNQEECRLFFEDICTVKELQSLAQRLEVAVMLRQGSNYQTISKATGASTATICRVNKCLNYGDGGYAAVLNRMEEDA